MKVHLSKIFIAATLLLIASCSGYNKLLRHGSSEDKYEKALELYNNQKYNKALTLFKEVETIFLDIRTELTPLCFTSESVISE